jgi:hypothetical protein
MQSFFKENFGDPFSKSWNEKKTKPTEPRSLTPDDRLAWDTALEKPRPERDVEAIRRLMRNRNPVRWHQVQSDVRWLRRQMKKAGLNPEDVRYIL